MLVIVTSHIDEIEIAYWFQCSAIADLFLNWTISDAFFTFCTSLTNQVMIFKGLNANNSASQAKC